MSVSCCTSDARSHASRSRHVPSAGDGCPVTTARYTRSGSRRMNCAFSACWVRASLAKTTSPDVSRSIRCTTCGVRLRERRCSSSCAYTDGSSRPARQRHGQQARRLVDDEQHASSKRISSAPRTCRRAWMAPRAAGSHFPAGPSTPAHDRRRQAYAGLRRARPPHRSGTPCRARAPPPPAPATRAARAPARYLSSLVPASVRVDDPRVAHHRQCNAGRVGHGNRPLARLTRGSVDAGCSGSSSSQPCGRTPRSRARREQSRARFTQRAHCASCTLQSCFDRRPSSAAHCALLLDRVQMQIVHETMSRWKLRWSVNVPTAVAVLLITSGVAGAQVKTASGAVEGTDEPGRARADLPGHPVRRAAGRRAALAGAAPRAAVAGRPQGDGVRQPVHAGAASSPT